VRPGVRHHIAEQQNGIHRFRVFRTDSHDFRPIYRTQKKVERTYEDDGKSIFKDAKAEIQTFKLFEERIYLPIAHAVQRYQPTSPTCTMSTWTPIFFILSLP